MKVENPATQADELVENGPVFILPKPRTGGTLLATLLGVHPALSMSYEMYEEMLVEADGSALTVDRAVEYIEAARHDEPKRWVGRIACPPLKQFVCGCRRSGLEVDDLLGLLGECGRAGGRFDTPADRLRFITKAMRWRARREGKAIWGGKAKACPELLQELHPGARFLFLIRDPRDILASRKHKGAFGTGPEAFAHAWAESMEALHSFAARPDVSCMGVHYEALATDPEPVLRDVCAFLGVGFEPVMLCHRRQHLSLLANPHGHLSAERIGQPVCDTSVGRYRTDLDAEEIDIVEDVARNWMDRLGYPRQRRGAPRLGPAGVADEDETGFLRRGSYFPLQWAYDFFEVLAENRNAIEILTYDDLDWHEDYAAAEGFPEEWSSWHRSLRDGSRDPDKVYVLIQHDVDRLPDRTMQFAERQAELGLKSNIMLFSRRVNRKRMRETGELECTQYDVDAERLRVLQDRHGFVIGYHCNAYERATFDLEQSMRIFEADVADLRKRFRIGYFSAHGGARDPNGKSNSAIDWPPASLRRDIRWVHNGAGVRFDGVFSDGGPNNVKRDPTKRDLRDFVRSWRPGKRYFVLLHPQYYADPCRPSGRMMEASWYREMVRAYTEAPRPPLWMQVRETLSALVKTRSGGLRRWLGRAFRPSRPSD